MARPRAEPARLVVHVPQIRGQAAGDLAREAPEGELCVEQRHVRGVHAHRVLRRGVDQDLVPVHLEVGRDANPPRARREDAGEIGGHRAIEAGGEADVVLHPHPAPVRQLRVERGHHRGHVGLVRGEDGRGGEVIGEARHEQPHRPACR